MHIKRTPSSTVIHIFLLASGKNIYRPSGTGLVSVGIQLAPVSSGCATPLSCLSPCKLFLDPGTALCFAPRRVHLSPYTPLTARVLSWRCGRAPYPSKSTLVLPSVWLGPRASAEGYCWVTSYARPKGP